MTQTSNRRNFIKAAGLAALALGGGARILRAMTGAQVRQGRVLDPGRKLNIACIGCGNKGYTDIKGVSSENIVALCDVDSAYAAKAFSAYPGVPKYTDFRRMLQKMDDGIDAVTISTPDHTHFAPAMLAISMGKHVFIQKPLAHTVWEVRELMQAARRHNVVTQMGNQGHAGEGVRQAREWVQAGLIGDVSEVHIWTSKMVVGRTKSPLKSRPPAGAVVPATLDWNLWLGPAPLRPYSEDYHPLKWRNWWDFGSGPLGDIGCHTMDAAFYALDLGAPAFVQAETAPFNDETFPDWSVITYEFPRRGARPPVKLFWYDGGKLPPRPPGLEPERSFDPRFGYYLVGGKGVMMDQSEKCAGPRLVPEARMLATEFPMKSIPRVPGEDSFQEWIAACKGGMRPGSNFEYAGPLTEIVQLGNLAIRAHGRRIQWDAARMRVPNAPELEQYLRRLQRAY